jgi:hypothetical protein
VICIQDKRSYAVLQGCDVSGNGKIGVGVRGKGEVQAVECAMRGNGQSGCVSREEGSIALIKCDLSDNSR